MGLERALGLIEDAAARKLKKLDLSGLGLSELPEELWQLTQLKVLVLGKYDWAKRKYVGNRLTQIPPEIGNLSSLTALYLAENQLTQLPEELTTLTNLRFLELSENKLGHLPQRLGKLSKLRSLKLGNNLLSELPPEIVQLTALTKLGLRGNKLTELPPEIVQITALTLLDLSSNQLRELPPEIVQLTALTSLYLDDNKLTELPPKVVQLTALTLLDLDDNKLTELPPEIVQLTALTELYLSSNQLRELPPEIFQLTALTSLDLSFNQLSELPPEIVQLTALTELYLSSNQLRKLPPEIVQLTTLTKLGLSSNQLRELPPEIVQLTALTELYLSRNQLRELPPEIVQLTALTKLDLWSNQLTELPPEIVQLTALTKLDLWSNQLTELPPEIVQLTALTKLDLWSNQLTELPPEIVQLTALTKLDLGFNQLRELPPEIGQLTALTELNLSSNQLRELPPEIVQLTALTELNLSDNQLTELPPEIVQLTALTELNLSDNQLTELPPEIVQLTALTELNLSSNQLTELPLEIVQLTALTELNLSSNQLTELPPEIVQLTALTELNLSSNQLTELPPEIVQLTALTSLGLSSNQLSELPPEIVQLTALTKLSFSSNQLSELPPEIVQLTALTSLDLSSNQLTELPPEIGQLTALTELNLSGNKLSELPPEIVQLTALTKLYLSSNQLSELPPEIVQLTALTELSLSSNQFSSISSFIKQLVSLKTLDFRGNPLPIPPEILGPKNMYKDPADVAKILEFYFSLKEEDGNTPLYEAKLLIVGEGGAGKTSLAKKIKNADYPLQDSEQSTEGIDVIRWEFPYSNDITFRTNIWDFGGQEIYHTTHQFFLTERSLYILVADTRQDNTDFYYWLKVIELLGTNSPVIIVKNEKQERQCNVNERQLRGEFLNLKAVLATNLETNRGLDEIETTIQQHISALPHVGQDLPKIWARVRAALENYAQNRNYITQAEYFDICRRNGFKDKQSMLFLSSYLHDLGVCLHFQTDKILKHTVILNPEWGTSAVYNVLDTDQVKTNLGCFTNADLEAIWHKGDYADMRDELLQLMLQFKVCYEIPGKQGNYIAPHLLATEQPAYDWDITNNLVLRYKYDFMPKGMVTRFIVEMHRFIEDNTLVWKTGVVLNDRAARAEITEHYPTNEIRIRVAGAQRRNLLTIIRHEFQKIHDSYERLKYQDLIPCNCSECKDTEQPEGYPYDTLQKALAKGKYEIECRKSFEDVNIRRLIDDVIDPTEFMEQSDLDEGKYGRFERDKSRLKSSRPKPEPIQKSPPTPMRNKIFISYSHQDTELFNELKIWLKPLERSGKLNVWDDTKIEPGQVWREEIEQALASAKVAVLLVSPNFIASDFIDNNELPPLLNAAEKEGLTILWIPISYSPYKDTEFEKYQATHSPQEPLDTLEKPMRNKAWEKIYQKIQTAFNPS
ncbi:leucine-rich repeat domain-containing protein [Leptothoe sp. PORK10 BA2]|uniref:leucine-rich repeat domain-containing protein n=1 Tax=Leptothoe sp. PORK10 BA2 TaxID=3110254 RepID=UPI002B1F18AC|nr:leucine-rich repeat domain-containing protein [Leptothoe sp. PORK10 BA2]MEA5467065.1 leucine-rich repeat domain-containing protein [Leptothoe sp. PORK10 BA2]